MAFHHPTAIPEGSLVLVTGATSYLASYVIKGFLERGYRVRGIVRNLAHAVWLMEEVFASFAQDGVFDLVEVPDMAATNAFDGVVLNSGASAVLHFATPFHFSPDPNEVIPPAVDMILGLLRAVSQEPSVKRFVHTSSIGAIYSPKGGVPAVLTKDSWNDAALTKAWAPPPYDPQRAPYVYAASKVETERALFRFIADNNIGFTAATVNPFFVIGPVLHKRYLGQSTAGWIHNTFNGEPGLFARIPPGCQVNVKDVAVLHIAAALDPEVQNERLLAWAEPINTNIVLAILRRLYPDRNFIDDIPTQEPCLATIGDEKRMLELMKKWGERESWTPLEQGVREGVYLEP
ncbi:putative aldehyde reductase 2 [Thozetella sp. PMI_491]|nr:putative aldehyde reductase 2 [Thozetella sp. PMI_491]